MKETQELKLFTQEEGLSISSSSIVKAIKDKLEFGDVNPVQVGIFLKKTEKVIEELKKDDEVKSLIYNETIKFFENKKYSTFGVTITERAVSTNYDFDVCNDPIYNRLMAINTQLKELLDTRKETLKKLIDENPSIGSIKGDYKEVVLSLPELIWIEGDGEEVTIKPPIKYQKRGLIYKENEKKDE